VRRGKRAVKFATFISIEKQATFENNLSRLELKKAATQKGLINSIVCDAGRTQIASGSRTVLGVGPGKSKQHYLLFVEQDADCNFLYLTKTRSSKFDR
jgi:hypothetical protein